MSEKGFYQSGFHTTLYCPTSEQFIENNEGILIRELNEDEFDTYAMIHCLGTGLPIDGAKYVSANNKVLYKRKGWHFYIGFVDQCPAAVAVMYMNREVASFTFTATLPGFQTMLLKRRIHDAALHGCKLIVSQTAYCSQSHRNMERVGLKIGYTRATWINK